MTVGIDTYITAAEADTLINGLLLSTDAQGKAWAALSQGDKEVYLQQALLIIETLPFTGQKSDVDQVLQFPRDHNYGSVPDAVKKAQALEACAMIGNLEEAAKRYQLRTMGISAFNAGSVSETYGGASNYGLFSMQAGQLLRKYIRGGVPIV